MSEPAPEPEIAPPPEPRRKWIAIAALFIATAVPLVMALGLDICGPLDAVGVHLDACKAPPAPAPTSSPDDLDAGVGA